jgi:hypothetical protein
MILIKATPLLFLLGVKDIVYWARELGGSKTSAYRIPAPRLAAVVFPGLLVFYLLLHQGVRNRSDPPVAAAVRARPPPPAKPCERPQRMTCWETVQAYGLRSIGYGREPLLPGPISPSASSSR